MIKPCDAKTVGEAKSVKELTLKGKDGTGKTRSIRATFDKNSSDVDKTSSHFYFAISETESDGNNPSFFDSNTICLHPNEVEALVNWWLGIK